MIAAVHMLLKMMEFTESHTIKRVVQLEDTRVGIARLKSTKSHLMAQC